MTPLKVCPFGGVVVRSLDGITELIRARLCSFPFWLIPCGSGQTFFVRTYGDLAGQFIACQSRSLDGGIVVRSVADWGVGNK